MIDMQGFTDNGGYREIFFNLNIQPFARLY